MEGSKYFAKVKTPSAKKGIAESGGVSWSDAAMDSLYHTNPDELSKYIDRELPDLTQLEKHRFMIQVQNDPNWEFEDLEYAWYRELDRLESQAKSNPDLLQYESFKNMFKEYEEEYPGDEAYREIIRKRRKGTTEDKLIDEFSKEESIY